MANFRTILKQIMSSKLMTLNTTENTYMDISANDLGAG